ncbi:hypothetical protein M0Q50_09635 [bacterium]|jgi:hypothetical protein|nr:hypothetical protein [bacterium]
MINKNTFINYLYTYYLSDNDKIFNLEIHGIKKINTSEYIIIDLETITKIQKNMMFNYTGYKMHLKDDRIKKLMSL